MKVFLNGKEINPEILVLNDGLNYGRFSDLETQVFELQLSKSEFINLIEKEYDEVRNDIKIDDEKFTDVSDFTNTNYCSLSELLTYKADFEEIVKGYLDRLLFVKIFPETEKSSHVIHSTDKITIHKNSITFRGRVFKKQKGLESLQFEPFSS